MIIVWEPVNLISFSEAEIHEKTPEILTVVLDAVVQGFDVGLLQKALYFFTQLPAAFTGYDLHLADLFFDGIIKGLLQGLVDRLAVVVNIVQVYLDAGHGW